MREGVLKGIGGFGALFEISKKYKEPVLVSGTDGVGTKLKLAFELNRHDTVGIDLVAMSVNDILVQGAEPLFFLDYFACGKLDVAHATVVDQGHRAGLRAGRLRADRRRDRRDAEHVPGRRIRPGRLLRRRGGKSRSIIDGSTIAPGDVVLGLASSGMHSNGYSLVRKIIEVQAGPERRLRRPSAGRRADGADAHLRQAAAGADGTRRVKGMVHITGGGLVENVPRVLGENLTAVLDSRQLDHAAAVPWLQSTAAWQTPRCTASSTAASA
jgi:phosphoribosylformylglycinamidine cyclo-ligase